MLCYLQRNSLLFYKNVWSKHTFNQHILVVIFWILTFTVTKQIILEQMQQYTSWIKNENNFSLVNLLEDLDVEHPDVILPDPIEEEVQVVVVTTNSFYTSITSIQLFYQIQKLYF